MENNKKVTAKRFWLYMSFFVILLVSLRISSCSSPEKLPYAAPVEMPTEALTQGRIHFNHHCATCHPEAMSGLGPAIINKPLPEFLIRFQIRNGLGVMPAFDENVLSDDEVEQIAEYLVYLRKNQN